MEIKEVAGMMVGKLEPKEIELVCKKCEPILLQLQECLKKYLPEKESDSITISFYQAGDKFRVYSIPFPIKSEIKIT